MVFNSNFARKHTARRYGGVFADEISVGLEPVVPAVALEEFGEVAARMVVVARAGEVTFVDVAHIVNEGVKRFYRAWRSAVDVVAHILAHILVGRRVVLV